MPIIVDIFEEQGEEMGDKFTKMKKSARRKVLIYEAIFWTLLFVWLVSSLAFESLALRMQVNILHGY